MKAPYLVFTACAGIAAFGGVAFCSDIRPPYKLAGLVVLIVSGLASIALPILMHKGK